MTALSDELRTQVAASGPKLDKVLDSAAVTVARRQHGAAKLSSLVEGNLKVLNGAIAAFEQTMTNVDSLVAPGSATAYQLNKALRGADPGQPAIQELEPAGSTAWSLLRGKQRIPNDQHAEKIAGCLCLSPLADSLRQLTAQQLLQAHPTVVPTPATSSPPQDRAG